MEKTPFTWHGWGMQSRSTHKVFIQSVFLALLGTLLAACSPERATQDEQTALPVTASDPAEPAVVVATPEPVAEDTTSAEEESQPELLQLFQVSGVVRSIEDDLSQARIAHAEIPGYMQAMTMPFNIGNTHEWQGIGEGDEVSFLLHVTEHRSWIDTVEKLKKVPSLDELPKDGSWRLVREVEPLAVGDTLPNISLTNQFSKIISTDGFRGKALALTFIYTRCPLPEFCPKLNQQFLLAQRKLAALESAPDNWQLLSISFDPVNDTPERLKTYAQAYQFDPDHWNFATGAYIDIDAITEQFGLQFYRTRGSVVDWEHTLRTVLIDPEGVIREIMIGNRWTSDELVDKLVRLMRGETLEAEDNKAFE